MAQQAPLSTPELVDHILITFHEPHRRDLPAILALARAVQERLPHVELVAPLSIMGQLLEQHMFKEEMRLFPMMLQGGNTLIRHLIDDLRAEHDEHRRSLRELRAAVAALGAAGERLSQARQLHAELTQLLAALERHMYVEDEVLFPRFAR